MLQKRGLVGRQHEADHLGELLDRMLAQKRGTMMIVGDHGIGKTTFVTRTLPKIAHDRGCIVLGAHRGTASYLGNSLQDSEAFKSGYGHAVTSWEASLQQMDVLDSFRDWEAILVQAIGMANAGRRNRASFFSTVDSSAAAMRDQLMALLSQDMLKWVPLLAPLLPGLQLHTIKQSLQQLDQLAALNSEQRTQLQQDLMAAVLCDVSANKPVLCLLDSCRQLDNVGWRLLETIRVLTASTAYTGAGIMVCLVARPMHHTSYKYASFKAAIEGAKEGGTYFELGPLREYEYQVFLRKCLGVGQSKPLPESLVQYLWEKSLGNPYFIKQLLDNLLAQQAVYVLDGHCLLNESKPLAGLAAPKTLSLIMKVEMDRLNSHEQMVMKVASVLLERAPTFTLSAMQAAFAYSVLPEHEEKWMQSPQGQAFAALLTEKTLEERRQRTYRIRSPIMLEVDLKLQII